MPTHLSSRTSQHSVHSDVPVTQGKQKNTVTNKNTTTSRRTTTDPEPVPKRLKSNNDSKKTKDSTLSLFCDVCWGRPKKQNMIFQQCRVCHVGVHNECYGMPGSTPADPNFVCHACKAVGSTVKVRARTRNDDKTMKDNEKESSNSNNRRPARFQLQVTQRPTECCLCSVDDGTDWFHAMHPIYDHYGKTGRQMLLPPDPDHAVPRLAWAHTLCCLVISAHFSTGGSVYGCTADGSYDDGKDEDDDGQDPNSDTSSINSVLDVDREENNDGEETKRANDTIHHFTYCLRLDKDSPDNAWTKKIKEQQELKCIICGSNDRRSTSFKIPLQCSANDDAEFPAFQQCHKALHGESCYVAMHVGCAIWGRNDAGQLPTSRRVYFFPGREISPSSHSSNFDPSQKKPSVKKNASAPEPAYTNIVSDVYCSVHAQDLVNAKISGADLLRYPHCRSSVCATAAATKQPAILSEELKNLSHEVEVRGQKRFATEGRPDDRNQIHSTQQQQSSNNSVSVNINRLSLDAKAAQISSNHARRDATK